MALVAAVYASGERFVLRAASQTAGAPPAATPQNPPPAPTPATASPSNGTIPAPGNSSTGELTIVIDAAHGGIDNGARGPNGINEKDVTLALARGVRAELVRRGYRVVMTRDGDADPTYDQRAADANSYAQPIFVNLHVASTGTAGTVRVYFCREPAASAFTANAMAISGGGAPQIAQFAMPPPSGQNGLVPWREAQVSFADGSRRLADLVQGALALKYSGSPARGTSAAVRDLRSVAAPALAIEISNVSANPSLTEAMSPAIATAIAQSLDAFHPRGIDNGSAGGSR
ncbi:MAG TPA: N-acetylmuramoyl-L-alanine amidase [Candidatus Acidoferrum sp.]|jgi:N-acetylmuramoyl-L-alanine amidase|nr:N-acetylmuramoyl-L-alanine amidase [Candidatus Acidoferrum sp.]